MIVMLLSRDEQKVRSISVNKGKGQGKVWHGLEKEGLSYLVQNWT